MNGGCGSAETLLCYQCICLTWKGLVGLGLPTLLTLIYLPRVLREATVNDWLLMLLLSLLTYASPKVSAEGVSHQPWYLYAVVMWSILAFTTDKMRSLPSIPFVGVMTYLSLVIADFGSMASRRPDGAFGGPGGMGILDGLIVRPAIGVGFIAVVYLLKAWLGDKHRTGKAYTNEARSFLLNVSPWYRRPVEDPVLDLVPLNKHEAD